MSDYINQITLDCLINKTQYNKYVAKPNLKTLNRKDKKFYRRRVYNLTKELLLSKDEPINLFPDVKHAFEHFVTTCVHYFQAIDNNDIIQSDYESINESLKIGSTIPELNVDYINSKEDADKLLMKTIKMNNNTLDNFVTKTTTKSQEEIIMPKQKDINLKEPSLKIKGVTKIVKKKNINNKYEEDSKT